MCVCVCVCVCVFVYLLYGGNQQATDIEDIITNTNRHDQMTRNCGKRRR